MHARIMTVKCVLHYNIIIFIYSHFNHEPLTFICPLIFHCFKLQEFFIIYFLSLLTSFINNFTDSSVRPDNVTSLGKLSFDFPLTFCLRFHFSNI